jgi:hypothetical protein
MPSLYLLSYPDSSEMRLFFKLSSDQIGWDGMDWIKLRPKILQWAGHIQRMNKERKSKVKISLLQAVEAHRVARG